MYHKSDNCKFLKVCSCFLINSLLIRKSGHLSNGSIAKGLEIYPFVTHLLLGRQKKLIWKHIMERVSVSGAIAAGQKPLSYKRANFLARQIKQGITLPSARIKRRYPPCWAIQIMLAVCRCCPCPPTNVHTPDVCMSCITSFQLLAQKCLYVPRIAKFWRRL